LIGVMWSPRTQYLGNEISDPNFAADCRSGQRA
jgi:hypothetical protein